MERPNGRQAAHRADGFQLVNVVRNLLATAEDQGGRRRVNSTA